MLVSKEMPNNAVKPQTNIKNLKRLKVPYLFFSLQYVLEGHVLLAALDVVDRKQISRLLSPSGRFLYQVNYMMIATISQMIDITNS